MRRVIALMLFAVSTNFAISQEMYIAGGGDVFISSTDALYINNNLTVHTSGSLTIHSDATSSGSLLVSGTITGNIIYQRYVNENGNGWHLISPPVTSQSINDFATNVNGVNSIATNSNRYAIAVYDNAMSAGSRWVYYDTTTAPMSGNFVNGRGYSLKRTVGGSFTFEGGMTSSDVIYPLTTASGTHYWSCIGNPYPSYLPVNLNANGTNVLGENVSILNPSFAALYFWDGAQYVAINQVSSATYLSPGQAFFVRAKSDNESFTFTESLASHQGITDNFNRTSNTTPSIIVTLSNGSQYKSTEIKYLENATAGLDIGFDAGLYYDGLPSFSLATHLVAESQGIDFTLQCLPDNAFETMVIPLSVNATANDELSFSAEAMHLPEGTDVYLEDTLTNTLTRINETTYQVTANNQTNGIGRFYIHTSQHALTVEDILGTQSINIYKTAPTNLRLTGLENDGATSIRMFSINGKEVLLHSFEGQHIQDVKLPGSLRTGVYIVQVISEKRNHTKKLIIE